MEYEWNCPDCKSLTSGTTTGNYDVGDKIECCWCGRVSIIKFISHKFDVVQTEQKVSPTQLERVEELSSKSEDKRDKQ